MKILRNSSPRFRVYTVFLLFLGLAFLLPAVKEGDSRLYLLAAAVPGGVLVFSVVCGKSFSMDRLLVLLALAFCSMNILAPAAENPDLALLRGASGAGCLIAMLAGSLLSRSFRPSFSSGLILSAPSLLLLLSPLISVPDSGLSSLAKAGAVLLLFPLAAFLSLRLRGPALLLGLCGFALLLLNTEERLFAAAWGLVFLLMFWICDGTTLWSILGLLGASGLLAGSYILFPAGLSEVPVSPLLTLYASAGFFGPQEPMAFSAENPVLPQDAFLSLGTQYGVLFLLVLLLLLLLLLWRGVSLARQSRTFFRATLASGAVFFLWLRVLFSLLTLSGILPFSLLPLPFLSALFPETAADLFLLGVLCGVSAVNEQDLKEDTHLAMLAR